jgi:hypothetical protein
MHVNLSIASFFISTAIILGLFISVAMLSVKKKERAANGILAAFLLIVACALSNPLMYETGLFHSMPFLIRTGEPFRFLAAPFFYFYAIALTSGKIKLEPRAIFHCIPFLICTIILAPFYMEPPEEKIRFVADGYFAHQTSFIVPTFISHIVMLAQFLLYLFYVKTTVKRYEEKAKDNLSSIEAISLSWLSSFSNIFYAISVFLLIVCISLLAGILAGQSRIPLNGSFRPMPMIVSAAMMILVFKALRQPHIFIDFAENQKSEIPGKKYELSGLLPEDADKYLQKLTTYMEKEKPYLHPELSLQQLSDALLIPIRHRRNEKKTFRSKS